MPTRRRPRAAPATTRKVQAGIELRNALLARSPDAWFTDDEAALYLGLALRTVRNARTRGALVPDGRAARAPIYRKATLDAFLESRAEPRP